VPVDQPSHLICIAQFLSSQVGTDSGKLSLAKQLEKPCVKLVAVGTRSKSNSQKQLADVTGYAPPGGLSEQFQKAPLGP